MGISFQLAPESPIEKIRNTRQVSHCWWSIARQCNFAGIIAVIFALWFA
jgi:hypothetical protein